MIKRLGALLLTAVMCVSVVGCGNNKTDKKDDNSGKKGTSATAEDTFFDNIPESLEGTTVHFATWIDHNSNESAEVLANFTALTGINVEIDTIPGTEYTSKVAALIAAGQSPDVLVCVNRFPTLLTSLMPLEQTIVNPTDSFWDQRITNMSTFNGHTYLVNAANSAWNTNSGCVTYNNRIFEDNGITTPATYVQEGKWTLENFMKCAKELSQVCAKGVSIDPGIFVMAYGEPMVSYDQASKKFVNNCKSESVLKYWQMLVKAREDGYAMIREDRTPFGQGKTGMFFGRAYALRRNGWFTEMEQDDLEFAPLPKLDINYDYPSYASTRGYGICQGSTNVDGAAYFLRYFLNMDHYDKEQVFRSDNAQQVYEEINKNVDTTKVDLCYDIQYIVYPEEYPGIYLSVFPELFSCTESQVNTALNSGSNRLDACVARANDLISKLP